MNMLFIKHFVIGFMVSEIPRVPYSGTVRIRLLSVFGYFPLAYNIDAFDYTIISYGDSLNTNYDNQYELSYSIYSLSDSSDKLNIN